MKFASIIIGILLVSSTGGRNRGRTAGTHILSLRVTNLRHGGLGGIVLAPADTVGDRSSVSDTDSGDLRIRLDDKVQENTAVALTIIEPKGKYAFLSPMDGKVQIPPFASGRKQTVVLVEAHDKGILHEGEVVLAITAEVLKLGEGSTASVHKKEVPDREEAIDAVAKLIQLDSGEVQAAIDEWIAEKKTDPFQEGVAALYQQRYANASELLSVSAKNRIERFQKARNEAYDATRLLGDSLYKLKRFQEAVGAYEEALKAKPNDEAALYSLAVAAEATGDLTKAEQAYIGASNFAEAGKEMAEVKESLGNFYVKNGRYKDALEAFSDANEMAFNDEYPEGDLGYLDNIINLLTKHAIDDKALAQAYEDMIERQWHANERPSWDEGTAKDLIALYVKMKDYEAAIAFYQEHLEDGVYDDKYVRQQVQKFEELEKENKTNLVPH
jgi:tetratricopeptide (TPR) repeat protein